MNVPARKGGFSLIELLVVIAIVGIVMSIALLSLGVLGDDRDLQKEGRRMIALVQVAQDEATMQGREFGLEEDAAQERPEERVDHRRREALGGKGLERRTLGPAEHLLERGPL